MKGLNMLWSSTDGKSWSITVGDTKAVVHLMDDEKTYAPTIWWSDSSKLIMEISDCIKEAKKACLEVIERIDAYEAQQAQEAEEASAMFRESDDGMPA